MRQIPKAAGAESPPPGGQHGGPGVNRRAVWLEEPSPAHAPPPLLPMQSPQPARGKEGARRQRRQERKRAQWRGSSTHLNTPLLTHLC